MLASCIGDFESGIMGGDGVDGVSVVGLSLPVVSGSEGNSEGNADKVGFSGVLYGVLCSTGACIGASSFTSSLA